MFEQAQNELRTLRDLLRFAVSRFSEGGLFFGHGADNAWDEAVYLLLHSLHLPLDRLEPFLDAGLTSDERTTVLRIIERRIRERLPAAYLTNEAWLAEYRFYVDQRVIVPRSFIAELLREQLAPWIDDPESVASVLDLCTGSGCLAIFAAHAFAAAQVDAIDISPDALAVAARNVSDYELTARIRLLESNLFAALDKERYDLIISNPPYVNAASMRSLPAEYQREPALALASGEDGLDLTRAILATARERLTPNGLLVVEIGHNREQLEAAFPDTAFTWLDTAAGDQYVFLLHRDQLP
ncbi:MAG: 50S ribosomal protein L3 N(5)-glutamine methyltransferase [Candidatus Accumulibacter meliphilus]|jgi:ribosomal protein L3 glutamine methyltransferase|uniref:Ribosomal protein uL3 glutamine methyltransferase n=1 Tax=Candidatus Accumulibacter meliphilus TaxID=2211374 RepID=A0A369XTX3_9PROT|nr:MAG: 50S ribosomal protein L3 N(5)-glutamine methyltransferase [Candidatus Accumulibacter meliphilus]